MWITIEYMFELSTNWLSHENGCSDNIKEWLIVLGKKMISILCCPSLLSLICSYELHITGSGIEAVRDAPFLGLKLFKVLLNHVRFLLYNNDIGIFYTVNEYK